MPLSGLSRSHTYCDTRTDAELAAAVQRKDEGAFNVLYERYFQRVYNFAYARVHNRAGGLAAADIKVRDGQK